MKKHPVFQNLRKEKRNNKIDYTDKDLEAVDDLTHEIEKNLRSLKRQSEQNKKVL